MTCTRTAPRRPPAQIARDADERGQGICRTCLNPIWNEGGLVDGRERDEGWSDRIGKRDTLICFRAADYRHEPLNGREAAIYDHAYTAGRSDPLFLAEQRKAAKG